MIAQFHHLLRCSPAGASARRRHYSCWLKTPAPPNAAVDFISPKDGEAVTSPFKVQFGLSGMGVAPAGVEKPNTGHHHLLIDATLTADEQKQPVASDARHVHFAAGRLKRW